MNICVATIAALYGSVRSCAVSRLIKLRVVFLRVMTAVAKAAAQGITTRDLVVEWTRMMSTLIGV